MRGGTTPKHNKSLSTPIQKKRTWFPKAHSDDELSHAINNNFGGRIAESIAHFLGTPAFIFWLSVFCVVWLAWNMLAPDFLRFDSAAFGFTALTLMLSLQASYAAPLILLAQERQTERDKVQMEQDRTRAERNLADTEFLTREIESIRLQLGEVATRDYIRQELKGLLEELTKPDKNTDETASSEGKAGA